MKVHTFKSTKGGTFNIKIPGKYKKQKLPFYKKWIDALESGKYRQCTGTLCEPNNKQLNYCCLGVLSKVQGRLIRDGNAYVDARYRNACLSKSNPSFDALKHYGVFPAGVAVYKNAGVIPAQSLMECNDDLRLSFKDIAKIIRTIYKA